MVDIFEYVLHRNVQILHTTTGRNKTFPSLRMKTGYQDCKGAKGYNNPHSENVAYQVYSFVPQCPAVS